MSSYQRYMPQQNHPVGRGRQQYQQPPPPPEPTIRENIDHTAQSIDEVLSRMTNLEAKLDKIVQYLQQLQNKQNQPLVNTNPVLNNINNNNNNTGNIFD